MGTSASVLLSDDAVYIRTRRGQAALVAADDASKDPSLRLLAQVNGFTNLRTLVEMAPNDTRAIGSSILKLFAAELIQLVGTAEQAHRHGKQLHVRVGADPGLTLATRICRAGR